MVLEKFQAKDGAWQIPLNCCLDDILGGGVESRTITQVYGPAGVGKTNFCLQAAVNCIRAGKKVIFIDTEGGRSIDRLRQIAGEDFEKVLENSFFYEVTSFEDQDFVIANLDKVLNDSFGLVVLDSAVALYRLYSDSDKENGAASKHDRLYTQMLRLLEMARKRNLVVLITSQVYQSTDDGQVRPFGWSRLEYETKAILELKMDGTGRREAVLRRHRSLPEDISVGFRITERGIEDL
jgi:DNA repair protein RadB